MTFSFCIAASSCHKASRLPFKEIEEQSVSITRFKTFFGVFQLHFHTWSKFSAMSSLVFFCSLNREGAYLYISLNLARWWLGHIYICTHIYIYIYIFWHSIWHPIWHVFGSVCAQADLWGIPKESRKKLQNTLVSSKNAMLAGT